MSAKARWPFSLIDRLPGDESATYKRLAKSRHVADLRTIVFVVGVVICSFWALGLIELIIMILLHLLHLWTNSISITGILVYGTDPDNFKDGISITDSIRDFVRFVGATGTLGAAIVAWAYQTGSRRLGVVDLFACEITTLCRVGTVVKFVETLTTQYDSLAKAALSDEHRPVNQTPAKASAPENSTTNALRFSSEENYFPVFENNAKDLQILEADVVENVTAFYTYMKTIRDMMRRQADLQKNGASSDDKINMIINIIFMIFLAYESARHAIDDLIEFDPSHAENKIVALFTELPAHRFLNNIYARGKFKDEIRIRRLNLRLTEYEGVSPGKGVVPSLCDEVRAHTNEEKWRKAVSLVDGLEDEFKKRTEAASDLLAEQPPATAKAA